MLIFPIFLKISKYCLYIRVSQKTKIFEKCTGTFLSGSGIIPKVQKWENKNFKIILSGREVEKRLKFRHKMGLVMFLLIRQTGNIF